MAEMLSVPEVFEVIRRGSNLVSDENGAELAMLASDVYREHFAGKRQRYEFCAFVGLLMAMIAGQVGEDLSQKGTPHG